MDDFITSKDIIVGAESGDQLCQKTVDKFVSIFGTETGNLGLKTMPYGGIYLIGGVTQGIRNHLLTKDTFMEGFKNKGRLVGLMEEFPVFLVNADIELGLLGAKERARRDLN